MRRTARRRARDRLAIRADSGSGKPSRPYAAARGRRAAKGENVTQRGESALAAAVILQAIEDYSGRGIGVTPRDKVEASCATSPASSPTRCASASSPAGLQSDRQTVVPSRCLEET